MISQSNRYIYIYNSFLQFSRTKEAEKKDQHGDGTNKEEINFTFTDGY